MGKKLVLSNRCEKLFIWNTVFFRKVLEIFGGRPGEWARSAHFLLLIETEKFLKMKHLYPYLLADGKLISKCFPSSYLF